MLVSAASRKAITSTVSSMSIGARPVWKMRRHDLEEFHGVVARWGAWDRAVGRLVDVLVEREKLPAGVALSMGSEKATA